jgi:hypothetical protein
MHYYRLFTTIFGRDITMINNQNEAHLTSKLSGIARNAARQMRLALLLPGMLVLLISACGPAAAPATAQPPVATTAPVNAVSTNAPAATQAPANNSNLPSDPLAAVQYALRTQPKSFPFKETTTIGSGSTQMVTSAVIESPQRIMMVDATHSVIILDGKCYEKIGDGAFQTCTGATTGQTAQANANSLLDQATIEAGIAIIKTATLSGSETLNGMAARIYDYTSSGPLMGMQVDASAKMWVDEKTGLPIKVVTTSTVLGSTTTFTQLITYDSTIKVQAP